ncbi:MAG TPA: hypothetical protein VI279_14375 [Rhodocyclaceae bacterium]
MNDEENLVSADVDLKTLGRARLCQKNFRHEASSTAGIRRKRLITHSVARNGMGRGEPGNRTQPPMAEYPGEKVFRYLQSKNDSPRAKP